MTLTIEPMYQEHSYITGNLRARNPRYNKLAAHPYERSRSLKGLLASLFLLGMLIIARESVANEPAVIAEPCTVSRYAATCLPHYTGRPTSTDQAQSPKNLPIVNTQPEWHNTAHP